MDDEVIVYKVIWSEEAETSFLTVVDDLLFRWTEREATIFINRTDLFWATKTNPVTISFS
ncbi:hypothetical protein SAMN05216436_106116 [bacterium A37T11]|nr:hypothetical protein SAMN05216436_106116 [bacterium A37T11]